MKKTYFNNIPLVQGELTIVVSDHARRYMIEREGIPAHKIRHINLAYDFALYGTPNAEKAKEIRGAASARVLAHRFCLCSRRLYMGAPKALGCNGAESPTSSAPSHPGSPPSRTWGADRSPT